MKAVFGEHAMSVICLKKVATCLSIARLRRGVLLTRAKSAFAGQLSMCRSKFRLTAPMLL